MDNLFENKRGE